MIPELINENLSGKTGSYFLPFIWYTGESKTLIAQEIQAVHDSGAKEFVFENRGGDWFATDFWWDIFKFVLETAKSMDMRVWSLDDSHVNTGSANDSLSKEENAGFRTCFRQPPLLKKRIFIAKPPRLKTAETSKIAVFYNFYRF